jgi:peptide/nickel transport system substrate-binding protein
MSKTDMSPHLLRVLTRIAVVAGIGVAWASFPSAGLAQPTGEITVAVPAEPESLLPRNGCSYTSQFVTDSVYERLLRRQPDGSFQGWLAESYEQLDDLTWRFKLRQGVTFSNGEAFNADSVLNGIAYYRNPDFTSQCISDYISLDSAKKVDDYTVDVTTRYPDPNFAASFGILSFMLPKDWLTNTPDTEASTTMVGTGPYMLTEWVKGSHLTLTANPDYWGEPKPTIQTIRLVPRDEGEVRAAMVKAGEADIAINLSPEQAAQMPKTASELTTEAVLIRINTLHPVLKDVRVRRAIAMSIDNETIMEALFPGVSSPLNGQIARPSARGYNPDLAPYPYDPAEAKRLVEEAGATGTELEFYLRSDLMPGVGELGEAIQAMVEETGLKIKLITVEAAPWRELLNARNEGQERTDLFISSASNQTFDSSRLINGYFGNGSMSHADNADFAARSAEVAALDGEERAAAYRELWQEVYDNVWVIPLFGFDYIHGLSERVDWSPRDDSFVFWNTVTFAE